VPLTITEPLFIGTNDSIEHRTHAHYTLYSSRLQRLLPRQRYCWYFITYRRLLLEVW